MKYLVLFLVLLAAPLSAQQQPVGRIDVNAPPVTVVDNDTTLVIVNTDSLAVIIDRGVQAMLERQVAECDCGGGGTPWWMQTAFLTVATWGAWSLHKLARQERTTNVDVDVEVPPREGRKDGGHNRDQGGKPHE